MAFDQTVPEALGQSEARSVGSGLGKGLPARGKDEHTCFYVVGALIASSPDDESPFVPFEPSDAVALVDLCTGFAGRCDQAIPHYPRRLALREDLGLGFVADQRNLEIALEEFRDLFQGPRPEQTAQYVSRPRGEEVAHVGRGRKQVAAAATADQDLEPACARSLEDRYPRMVSRCEDRGHQPRRTSSHDDDVGHGTRSTPHGRS